MKQERNFPSVVITRKAENAARAGHPWVYAEEITERRGELRQGCIADVFSQKGAWLGAGFYSETSKIGVRILSDNANESFGPEFFERRVKYALEYRRAVMEDLGCCRLIFGEADGLPGLTVDKFSDILVAQVLSYGTDSVKDVVYRALCEQLEAMGEHVSGVYERNEAALHGAEHVTAVDVSESAVEMARRNAVLNGLEGRMDFLAADVFELLPRLCEERAKYDLVILDPPAFTKSRRTIHSAERGYREINYRAMRLLPRGGYLATCSCSHFMESENFEYMLKNAAKDANVRLREVEVRKQAPDHPILWNVPETSYLKFYIFQIV